MNRGYRTWAYQEIVAINDTPLKNLAHAVSIIDNQKTGFLKLQREDGYELVLDIEQARASTADILRGYNIPNDRSDDLK